MNHRHYTAYGLTIDSTLHLPELVPLDAPSNSASDIQIRYGDVPIELDQPDAEGVLYQAKPNQFLLRIGKIARYLVTNGREITIDRVPEVQESEIRVFLLGSVLAALLHQRGLLVLHGSAIETPAGAVLFVGPSGIGKSTLAAAFHQRGYSVLADDVCAVGFDEQGIPLLHPAFPQLKLWANTLDKLGQNTETLQKVRPELEKYALPLHEAFKQTALRVYAVYHLAQHNKPDFLFEQLQQIEKFQTLSDNTYRQHFLGGLGVRATHFRHVAAASNHIRVGRITRPIQPLLLDELIALVEPDFANAEMVDHE
jgi:hypothetical protein